MTAARLLLIIPFVYFILQGKYTPAGFTALAAMLTDLDGTVARAIGATSKFGSLFDPIVDITFEIVGFAVLVWQGLLSAWPVALFLAATLYKAIPQTQYLRKHGTVKSIVISKTMGMIGFGSVVAGAFAVPSIVTSSALLLGALGYTILGTVWLRS